LLLGFLLWHATHGVTASEVKQSNLGQFRGSWELLGTYSVSLLILRVGCLEKTIRQSVPKWTDSVERGKGFIECHHTKPVALPGAMLYAGPDKSRVIEIPGSSSLVKIWGTKSR
jgi:hypothetical protein